MLRGLGMIYTVEIQALLSSISGFNRISNLRVYMR
jgi:hypothetical protein